MLLSDVLALWADMHSNNLLILLLVANCLNQMDIPEEL